MEFTTSFKLIVLSFEIKETGTQNLNNSEYEVTCNSNFVTLGLSGR